MRSRPGRKVHIKTPVDDLRAAGILLPEAAASGPIDLSAVFGNAHPVEVEIGSGKGTFLLRRAADRPEINLLGIEWLTGYAAYAADRAFRAGLKNVRLMCADAEQIFSKCIGGDSINRIHIYFPDPWPKRRHRRNRLIKPRFVGSLHRALKLGGIVHLVTDHLEYYHQIFRTIRATVGLNILPFSKMAPTFTNYERKYTSRGKEFYSLTAFRYR